MRHVNYLTESSLCKHGVVSPGWISHAPRRDGSEHNYPSAAMDGSAFRHFSVTSPAPAAAHRLETPRETRRAMFEALR